VRIADAFDFRHGQQVDALNCTLSKSRTLVISASSETSLKEEIAWAGKKGNLIQEVFNLDLSFQKAKPNRSR
jgi:hypothetical protein